jgi:hypothetical protein
MLTTFSVIVGIALAVVCARKGFFPAWAIVFNIMVAVYATVMLAPYWVELISGQGTASDFRYHIILAMLATAGMIFAVLQIIATTFITGTYMITFPKLFDYVASATIGFLGGKVIAGFLILILCITPMAAKPSMDKYNLRSEETPKELKPVIYTCSFMATATLQVYTDKSEEVIKKLITPTY